MRQGQSWGWAAGRTAVDEARRWFSRICSSTDGGETVDLSCMVDLLPCRRRLRGV